MQRKDYAAEEEKAVKEEEAKGDNIVDQAKKG